MADTTNMRQERIITRITRLLKELEYEITRGMLERDIGEEMRFRFYVPISNKIKDGVVFCEFRTRPSPVLLHDARRFNSTSENRPCI